MNSLLIFFCILLNVCLSVCDKNEWVKNEWISHGTTHSSLVILTFVYSSFSQFKFILQLHCTNCHVSCMMSICVCCKAQFFYFLLWCDVAESLLKSDRITEIKIALLINDQQELDRVFKSVTDIKSPDYANYLNDEQIRVIIYLPTHILYYNDIHAHPIASVTKLGEIVKYELQIHIHRFSAHFR